MKKLVVGITGASGSIYAKRFVEEALRKDITIHLICTDTGKQVFSYELGLTIESWVQELKTSYPIYLEDVHNLFAGVASGSYSYDGVIIIPCSMSTLGEISYGVGKNLLTRTVDVALKEHRQIILVPRETPLSSLHLENMLRLSNMGATILPAMAGFYHKPTTMEELVDFVVGKVFDQLHLDNTLFQKWKGNES